MPLPSVGGWNYLRALASSSAAWMALIVRSVAGGSAWMELLPSQLLGPWVEGFLYSQRRVADDCSAQ